MPFAVGCIAAAPSLAFIDQGLLGHSIWDEVCIYPGLSDLSFFVQDFLGGLYVAIGMLFYWIMPYSHSHIPTPTLIWLGLLHPLYLPSHSLTHSTPTGLPVLRSHQVLRASTHDFGLVCFVPSPSTTCSLTLPQQVSSTFHGSLAYGLCHRWFGCSSNVSHQ